MKSTTKQLLVTAASLMVAPAFAQELMVWERKSGDPATVPYYAKAK